MSKSIYDEVLENTQVMSALISVTDLNYKRKLDMLTDIEKSLEQAKKQEKLLELYKELSNQKSNLYSYDEKYRQYSYNRDVQVIVRYIETQIKELEK